jgi:hypothetical protein
MALTVIDRALAGDRIDNGAFQVRVLFDFDAQEGSGELCIRTGETLTITRQVSVCGHG